MNASFWDMSSKAPVTPQYIEEHILLQWIESTKIYLDKLEARVQKLEQKNAYLQEKINHKSSGERKV